MIASIRPFALALALTALLGLGACASDGGDGGGAQPSDSAEIKGTYDEGSIVAETTAFFGSATKGLATVIEKVFADHGRPNAYIVGEEGSGAIGVGLRYGSGTLRPMGGKARKVYWQGPTLGFDFGGNASKVFVLIYDLQSADALFRRFPGVEGTYYFVAGVGVNYQQAGDTVLAPIRTGVGLRAGVNIGYLHYSRKRRWIPF